MAMASPPAALTPPPWGAGPFAYEKVVQPVFDNQCVRCHSASHRINLTGTLDADKIPASFRTIVTQGLVNYFDYTWGTEHSKAAAMTFGTLKSKLPAVIERGHHGVTLTSDQMQRIKCWIDLNCPLWPDYLHRPDR